MGIAKDFGIESVRQFSGEKSGVLVGLFGVEEGLPDRQETWQLGSRGGLQTTFSGISQGSIHHARGNVDLMKRNMWVNMSHVSGLISREAFHF